MFADPVKILKMLGLREDNVVADLGAGTGHYTLAAGAIVGRGKVYAVELQKDFVGTINSKIKEAHLSNVETIWGNVEKRGGTKIGDNIVDAVIASNILFQVEDKETFVEEVKRILKPKGKVLLVDWSPASILKQRNMISRDKARVMFEKKGFSLDREVNAGEHHYGMILVKN